MADVMRSPTLRTHCILVWFGWFACGLSFFGFSQFQAQLGGNIFVNVILGGIFFITFYCGFLDCRPDSAAYGVPFWTFKKIAKSNRDTRQKLVSWLEKITQKSQGCS